MVFISFPKRGCARNPRRNYEGNYSDGILEADASHRLPHTENGALAHFLYAASLLDFIMFMVSGPFFLASGRCCFLPIRSFPLICVHSIIRVVLQKAVSGQKELNSGPAEAGDY